MNFHTLQPDDSLSPYIKSIMVFKEQESHTKTQLPFFADGFPGLMYQQSPKGLYVNPHNKRMPALFLYGQTIEPIQIEIIGTFQMIVFQLYPFVLKHLFGIDPKSLNDDCYDLTDQPAPNHGLLTQALFQKEDPGQIIKELSNYLFALIEKSKSNFDLAIISAIDKILTAKGKLNLASTAKEVHLTKRTFERRFLSETGLSPKQFAKIIQFHSSLTQLSIQDYTVLSDIVYKNGFADQSHFIRVFKSYTGQTPMQFASINPTD